MQPALLSTTKTVLACANKLNQTSNLSEIADLSGFNK